MRQKQILLMPFAAAALALAGCATPATYAERSEPLAVPEFAAKVKEYTKLVDRLEKGIGKLPDKADAERINAHKQALTGAIRKERAGAKPGDVFVASEQAVFRRLVRSEVQGSQGAAARKTIAEDNPKKPAKPQEQDHQAPPVKLVVNGPYPDGAPLSTVPPTLLLRMPKLPDSLDFRFVGKALVLFDARANLIVDFIPDAL